MHPKGYRPYVPLSELVLGGINALLLVSGFIFLCPALILALGVLSSGFSITLPLYWSAIGVMSILVDAFCIFLFWAFQVRHKLASYQHKLIVWAMCALLLVLLWTAELWVISQWFSPYLIDD
jgi:hypothetical protein